MNYPRSPAVYGTSFDDIEKPFDYKYYFFLFQKNFYIVLTFFVIVVTLSSIYAAKIPDRFQAKAQIIIERPPQAELMHEQAAAREDATGWTEDYYKTQQEIITGATVMRQVIQELKLTNYFEGEREDAIIKKLRTFLSVQRIKGSRLFDIVAVTSDAKLAANLANATARAYIRKNFEDTLYYSKELMTWLPEAQGTSDTITIEDPFGNVRRITREELINSLPTIQTDPTIRGLQERKNALESELKLLLQQYREKHPKIIKARSTLKFLDDSIDAEKARIIKTLQSKATGTMRASYGRVTEEAQVPANPVGPNRFKIVAIAAMVQLLVSFLIIFVIDYFDDTIHSLEDLERKGILLPFLGPIPLVKGSAMGHSPQSLIVYNDQQSEITESFRYLRVAINFSASPESLKNLVFTSCVPHEGKSFVTQNIAASLALDGNKTLLVDADLRRPVAHRTFRIENTTGLSNYLTSNVEFDGVVKETYVENLSIVASGPVSPNPAEILGSDRMKQFLEEARHKFDRVLIDCPPLMGLGDGFVVGHLVGHLILVVFAGNTPADLIKRIQPQIDKSAVKVIGLVLNGVDMEKERLGGYSKYYYHTYTRYYRQKERD